MKYNNKISVITKSSPYTFSGGSKHGTEILTEQGDVFQYFGDQDFIESLKEGVKIRYDLLLQEGKKAKASRLSIYKRQALIPSLDSVNIAKVLFIDIETGRLKKDIKKGEPTYEAWAYKRRKEGETTAAELKKSYREKASLYSEFSRILCITAGVVKPDGSIALKNYYSESEAELLEDFITDMGKFKSAIPSLKLCGHAIDGFDIPFILRRLVVNRIRVPYFIDVTDKKPWELKDISIDTAQLWKATGFYGASLSQLCLCLGIDSPKQSIDGSMVSDEYFKNGVENIVLYCEQDVFAQIKVIQYLLDSEISTTFTSNYKKDVKD
jgi:hypothetical protein